MTTPARTALLVVSFDAADLLARHLAAVGWAEAGITVVVVDNFAGAPARRRVSELAAEQGWTLVAVDGNPGFGAAVNRGAAAARAAGCDVVVLLNPDAAADPATVEALAAVVRADPAVAVSPRVVTSTGAVAYRGSQWSRRDGRIRGLPPAATGVTERWLDDDLRGQLPGPARGWLTGACLAVHLDTFAAVDGFDERYFLYWEDIDFSDRLLEAGVRLLVRLDLTVVHDEGGTHGPGTGSPRKSNLYYRWNCRNRLAFAAFRLPRRDAWRWVATTPVQSAAILMRGGRRQVVESPTVVAAAVRGSLAGVALVARTSLRPRRGAGDGPR